MARITPPATMAIPVFQLNGVPLLIPADLPEGGFLQIVVGANPVALPTPSVELPKGCMVAIIPPQVAENIRGAVHQGMDLAQNPHVILPPGAGNGNG